jgi:hypothetical protein
LLDTVPDFARLWSRVELWTAPRATVVEHDELGDLYFDRVTYVTEYQPPMRVLMFIPGDANTARAIAGLERPMEDELARANTRYLSAATCTATGALRVPRVVTAKQVVRSPSSGATPIMRGEDAVLLRPRASGAASAETED